MKTETTLKPSNLTGAPEQIGAANTPVTAG